MRKAIHIGFIYDEPKPTNLRYEQNQNDAAGHLFTVWFPLEAKGSSYSQVGLLYNGRGDFPGTEGLRGGRFSVNHGFEGYCSECGNENLMFTATGVLMAVCAECGALLRIENGHISYTDVQARLRALHMFWSLFENYENNPGLFTDPRRELSLIKFDNLINLKDSKKYFVV